jgi:hypothetical protein
MKTHVALIGLSAILLWSSAVLGGDEPAWPKYTSKKAGFSVMMPGTPKESTKTLKTAYDNFEQTRVTFVSGAKGTAYAIHCTVLPDDLHQGIGLDEFLDSECDLYVETAKAKLRSQKKIMLGTLPGREIEYSLLNGRAISRTRIFLVDGRLYHVTVLMPRDRTDSGEMERFLDSFRLETMPTPLGVELY